MEAAQKFADDLAEESRDKPKKLKWKAGNLSKREYWEDNLESENK